ncbi:CgeB family protein [Achromobacter marplatensis]|uniref:Spore maturation protein CgeB n=1 Tax=Achromobacter marplatensis TaxID=470868 RepID=A0ABX9GIL7_9BURK|nr:hypothetical protein [Achromobacter marplatensis]RBP24401.1 spore maturation protein CgeB [Achromobacter marplatensis]CAB3626837.1 hypothetical protein LMG26219_00397 [Achromobacter marplatensis]
MHIAIFDSLLEEHLARSLADALRHQGHEIISTGLLGKTVLPLQSWQSRVKIEQKFEAIIAAKPDVLVNFRPGSLSPAMLIRLRQVGIRSVVWLADDPVLYTSLYRHVVDFYDLVLHAGGADILEFYKKMGHRPGVNFPFWCETGNESVYDVGRASSDFVFLGNAVGPVKTKRNDILARFGTRISCYGKTDRPELGIFKGYLSDSRSITKALLSGRLAVNIPQYFGDYVGSENYFHGMEQFGSFYLPSRVVQYAALGVPHVSLGVREVNKHLPEFRIIDTSDLEDIEAKLGVIDPTQLQDFSAKLLACHRAHFSPNARADFLTYLLTTANVTASSDLKQSEFLYRNYK